MSEEEAIALVMRDADTENFPVLSEDEVTAIVEGSLIGADWEAEEEYSLGQIVRPTVPNGHFYKCTVAGTSGEDEPDWDTTLFSETGDNDITWQEFKKDNGDLYNTRKALYEAWNLKATKAVQFPDSTEDGVKDSQVYDHCIERAKFYAPLIY